MSEAYILLAGALVVIISQVWKFGQLDLTDPITSRYIAMVPGGEGP